jgi:alpha-ketoglutarate-dependent taurine dioxygenase
MKISKIPGLGRFGIFIDDLDFEHLTDEEWMEIGKLHLESLVTIIRNVKLPINEYERRMKQWGKPRSLSLIRLFKKYNLTPDTVYNMFSNSVVNGIEVSEEDRKFFKNTLNILASELTKNPYTTVTKVTGKHRPDGSPEGLFADGELLWHSNESGNLTFSPAVSLLGVEGVVGSATGFLTTTDWYENQSESFRSELDEMIIQHRFTPGRINPGLREDQDHILNRNMCPAPIELPLIAQSPAGIKGLHYSVNTIDSIKGMSIEESNKMFEHINKTLFVDKYIYDHWYQNDNDLCLFDNSITLHRRLGGITNRMCYRIQYVYDQLAPNWNPWLSEPYAGEYEKVLTEINEFTAKNLKVVQY